MAKATTIIEALKRWEEREGRSPAEAKDIGLQFQMPPLERMTTDLGVLEKCVKLSLSTNNIDRIFLTPNLKNLKILALGRNNIKTLYGLEPVADSLEELWISYNFIEKLKGIETLKKLKIFYIAHNLIRDWNEISKLTSLRETLEEVIFIGNPIYDIDLPVYEAECTKRLPFIKKLDGKVVGV